MLGVPAITFVSPPFRTLALRRREAQGVPDLPIAWVVHPMMNLLPDEIEALADRVLMDVVKAISAAPVEQRSDERVSA